MFTQITQITDKFMVKRRSNVLWAVVILSASRMFLDLLFALLERYICYSNMMTSRPSVIFDLPFSHHSQNKALLNSFMLNSLYNFTELDV